MGANGVSVMSLVSLTFAASPYTAVLSSLGWMFYLVSAGTSDFIFNLPAASGMGRVGVIKKMDSTAFNIDVTPDGTDTIDGANSVVAISLQYDVLRIAEAGVGTWAIW